MPYCSVYLVRFFINLCAFLCLFLTFFTSNDIVTILSFLCASYSLFLVRFCSPCRSGNAIFFSYFLRFLSILLASNFLKKSFAFLTIPLYLPNFATCDDLSQSVPLILLPLPFDRFLQVYFLVFGKCLHRYLFLP